MNWNRIEPQWKDFAGAARAHWSKLTDEDWQTVAGKKEQLVARIQERYGIPTGEAEKQVDEWSGAMYGIERGEDWLAEFDRARQFR